MRIYTEVIFNWDDKQGKLLETSSNSFEANLDPMKGEIALCGYDVDVTSDYWDAAGNKWTIQMDLGTNIGGGEDSATAERYLLNGTTVVGWDAWLTDSNTQSHRRSEFQKYVKTREEYVKDASGKDTLFGTKEDLKDYWTNTFHEELPEDVETSRQQYELYKGYLTSGKWAHAGGMWQEITTLEKDPEYSLIKGEWKHVGTEEQQAEMEIIQNLIINEEYDDKYDYNDDGTITVQDLQAFAAEQGPLDTDLSKLPADEAAAATTLRIDALIKQWEEIVTPGGFDIIESEVKGYISALKEKEEAVKTAYTDIFGEEGTLLDIEETWETAMARGRKKYTTDIGTYGTEQTEGLEGTVVGREGELEALREEAGGEIRAAEAKIGAAGFASTGVGQTARDRLAKEIGEEARGIDEGFTEDRSDVKRSYLEKVDPLEKEYGDKGTAYEDYIQTRDLAAKSALTPWKTASEAYEQEKKRYEETYLPGITDPTAGAYATELGDIGVSMMEAITRQQAGSDLVEADPDFDPFATGAMLGEYDPSQFGLMDKTFFYTGLPETVFEEPFYEPYTVDPTMKLYDPEEMLPWEEEGGSGSGGGFRIPGIK